MTSAMSILFTISAYSPVTFAISIFYTTIDTISLTIPPNTSLH